MNEGAIELEHVTQVKTPQGVEREVKDLQALVASECKKKRLWTFGGKVVPPEEEDWELVVFGD